MVTVNGFQGKCSKTKIPLPILLLMMMVVVSLNFSMVETSMCRSWQYCCHANGPYWEDGQLYCDKCCDLDQRCGEKEKCCGGYHWESGSCLRCCPTTDTIKLLSLIFQNGCDKCCLYYGKNLMCNKCCPRGDQCTSFLEYCCFYDSDSGNCLRCCDVYLTAVCNFAQECCAGNEYVSHTEISCSKCCAETGTVIGLTVAILVVIVIIVFFVFVAADKVGSKIPPPPPIHPLITLSQAEAQDQDDEEHNNVNDVTENLILPVPPSLPNLPSPPPPSYDEVFPWNPEPSAPPYLTLPTYNKQQTQSPTIKDSMPYNQ